MKTMTRKQMIEWVIVFGIAIALILAVLAIVKPVGAASVCGPLVGNANLVETALTTALIPHMVFVDASTYASCSMVGCPKPVTICRGWRIRLSATTTRWLDLTFGRSGTFYGVR